MDDKDNYFLPFPRRLRLLFDETRANQTEVAEYVGVSRQAVSQWMNGKTTPDCYNFKKVAEFFKVPLEYLYGETDSIVSENIALAESLGLSDKAISKMQNWASRKRKGLSFPLSEILSDIIADDEFDKFIERIQLVIAEYIEHRFHQEHETNQDFYDSEQIVEISKRDLDNHARIIGMRAIETEDLATFYQYQALQYLERVLEALPDEYYVTYYAELKEKEASE
jgi:transcriptional regulator with XRE-family HTH domain